VTAGSLLAPLHRLTERAATVLVGERRGLSYVTTVVLDAGTSQD